MEYRPSLYALLGLDTQASEDELEAAYRRAGQRFHPDVNPHPGAALHYPQIKAAYQVLSSPTRRIAYNLENKLALPEYFNVEVLPSKTTLPVLPEKQVLYVLVMVQAREELLQAENSQQIPLNLVLVLDRSSSMRGQRLERVRFAANKIIDELSENDFLGIVTFSDRAEKLVPSTRITRQERESMKAALSLMTASGGTEIFQGLELGVREISQHLQPRHVNHVVLLTDGRTFDAEDLSLELADAALKQGIGISAMGIGDEWNDVFLDELAARTGGHSAFIHSPDQVDHFLNERVRSLGSAYAERIALTVIPDFDVSLEQVFKLSPSPQPIDEQKQPIPLGTLEGKRPLKTLLQLKLPANLPLGERPILRLDLTGDILQHQQMGYRNIYDLSIAAEPEPPMVEPPRPIMDALGKLTLYRIQQKAEEALQRGQVEEAAQHMQVLSTRLEEAGQFDLARTVQMETIRIRATQHFSEEGRKTIKFGTRMLLPDQE